MPGADIFVLEGSEGSDTVADYCMTEGDVPLFAAGTAITSTAGSSGLPLAAGETSVTLIGVSRIEDVSLLFARARASTGRFGMTAYGISNDAAHARNTDPDETLVLVDHRVPDSEFLLASLAVPSVARRVGPEEDGLGRLREMAERFPRRPVTVICHGAPGALILGKRAVTADSVRAGRQTLTQIRKALAGAPVSLFACSVGEGLAGRTFLAMLAAGFGAPVSAASRPIGDAEKGGTWVLDVAVSTDPARLASNGAPECWPFDPAKLPAYKHLLELRALPGQPSKSRRASSQISDG